MKDGGHAGGGVCFGVVIYNDTVAGLLISIVFYRHFTSAFALTRFLTIPLVCGASNGVGGVVLGVVLLTAKVLCICGLCRSSGSMSL